MPEPMIPFSVEALRELLDAGATDAQIDTIFFGAPMHPENEDGAPESCR